MPSTETETTLPRRAGAQLWSSLKMKLKSESIKQLEKEGLQQTEFLATQKDDISLSCLEAVKSFTETGKFGEAQNELEGLVQRAKNPRDKGRACLLLAELFNKWASASAYTRGLMEHGTQYADHAVQFFSEEVQVGGDHQAGAEKLLSEALFWKALNFASIGGVGGSENLAVDVCFEKADQAFAAMITLRESKPELCTKFGEGTQLFLQATISFCKSKALQGGHMKTEAQTHIELWERCLKMYHESYEILSGARGDLTDEAVKAVTMIAVCYLLLGQNEEGIKYVFSSVSVYVVVQSAQKCTFPSVF